MVDLAARAEVVKLAADLGVDAAVLAFLEDADADAVADLRRTIDRGRFAHLEPHLRRLSGTVNLLPLSLTARIAKATVGPALSGKVASVLDPADSVKFARHYDAAYMARVSVTLQPGSTTAIVDSVHPDLAVKIARELMGNGEFVTLGRLVCAAPDAVVDGVIAQATPPQLLMLAYFTDDHDQLDRIISGQDEETLIAFVRAAVPDQVIEALSVITFVRPDTADRLVAAATQAGLLEQFRAVAAEWNVRIPSLQP